MENQWTIAGQHELNFGKKHQEMLLFSSFLNQRMCFVFLESRAMWEVRAAAPRAERRRRRQVPRWLASVRKHISESLRISLI